MPTVNICLHSNIEEENNLGVIYLHCTSVSKVLMKKTALFYLLLSVLIAQLPQFLNTREGKNDFSEKKNFENAHFLSSGSDSKRNHEIAFQLGTICLVHHFPPLDVIRTWLPPPH